MSIRSRTMNRTERFLLGMTSSLLGCPVGQPSHDGSLSESIARGAGHAIAGNVRKGVSQTVKKYVARKPVPATSAETAMFEVGDPDFQL